MGIIKLFEQFINENSDSSEIAENVMKLYSDSMSENGIVGHDADEIENNFEDYDSFVESFFTNLKKYFSKNKIKKLDDTVYQEIKNNNYFDLLEMLDVAGYFNTPGKYSKISKQNAAHKLVLKYA